MNSSELDAFFYGPKELYFDKESNRKHMKLIHQTNSKEEFQGLLKQYQRDEKINHEHITPLRKTESQEIKNWCSNTFIIERYFDYNENNLFLELKKR